MSAPSHAALFFSAEAGAEVRPRAGLTGEKFQSLSSKSKASVKTRRREQRREEFQIGDESAFSASRLPPRYRIFALAFVLLAAIPQCPGHQNQRLSDGTQWNAEAIPS
jgi:hypothetical protein